MAVSDRISDTAHWLMLLDRKYHLACNPPASTAPKRGREALAARASLPMDAPVDLPLADIRLHHRLTGSCSRAILHILPYITRPAVTQAVRDRARPYPLRRHAMNHITAGKRFLVHRHNTQMNRTPLLTTAWGCYSPSRSQVLSAPFTRKRTLMLCIGTTTSMQPLLSAKCQATPSDWTLPLVATWV